MRLLLFTLFIFSFNLLNAQEQISSFANIDKFIKNNDYTSNLSHEMLNNKFTLVDGKNIFSIVKDEDYLKFYYNKTKIKEIKSEDLEHTFWDSDKRKLYFVTTDSSHSEFEDKLYSSLYSFSADTKQIDRLLYEKRDILEFDNNIFYFTENNDPTTLYSLNTETNNIKTIHDFNFKYADIDFIKKLKNTDYLFIQIVEWDGTDIGYFDSYLYNLSTNICEKIFRDELEGDDGGEIFFDEKKYQPQLSKNPFFIYDINYYRFYDNSNYESRRNFSNINEIKGLFVFNNKKIAEYISNANFFSFFSSDLKKYGDKIIIPVLISENLDYNCSLAISNKLIEENIVKNMNQIELKLLQNSIYDRYYFISKSDYLSIYGNSIHLYRPRNNPSENFETIQLKFTAIDKQNLAIIDKYIVKPDLSKYSSEQISQAKAIISSIDTLSMYIYSNQKSEFDKYYNNFKTLISGEFKKSASNKNLLIQIYLQHGLDLFSTDISTPYETVHYQTRNVVNSLFALYSYKFRNQQWTQIFSLFDWYKPSTKVPNFEASTKNLVENLVKLEHEFKN